MNILSSLGVDWTFFVHLVCFGISYIFLTRLVLKPYANALREREERTVGNEETAVRIIEETNRLKATYEQKARALNAEIKHYFDQSRSQAMAKYDELVNSARAEANTILKTAQSNLEKEIQAARKSLADEIPAISSAIASKLAGKEISL